MRLIKWLSRVVMMWRKKKKATRWGRVVIRLLLRLMFITQRTLTCFMMPAKSDWFNSSLMCGTWCAGMATMGLQHQTIKKSLRIIQQNNRKKSIWNEKPINPTLVSTRLLARALLMWKHWLNGSNALNWKKSTIISGMHNVKWSNRASYYSGEVIHMRKVFYFCPHTEWNWRVKRVSRWVGSKVCVIEDHHQFILHHQVMEKVVDSDVTVSMVEGAKARFPTLSSVVLIKVLSQIIMKTQSYWIHLHCLKKGSYPKPIRLSRQQRLSNKRVTNIQLLSLRLMLWRFMVWMSVQTKE